AQPAFDAPSLTQITAAILEREPVSLRQACPLAPPGLEAVVKNCLAKNHAEHAGPAVLARHEEMVCGARPDRRRRARLCDRRHARLAGNSSQRADAAN